MSASCPVDRHPRVPAPGSAVPAPGSAARAFRARWIAALAVATIPVIAWAQPATAPGKPALDACGPAPRALCVDGPWFDFARIEGRINVGTRSTRFTLRLYQGQEMVASFDETDIGFRRQADILSLANRYIAVKHDGPLVGDEPELINTPLLATKLAVSLLQLALPKGPKEIAAARPIRLDEARRILRTDTPSASAFYAAPWSAAGSVAKGAPGEYRFTLKFQYKVPDFASAGARMEDAPPVEVSGTVAFTPKRERLSDRFNLTDYVFEGVATPGPGYRTLGEARRALKIPAPPK